MLRKYAIFCKYTYSREEILKIKKNRLLKERDLYDRIDVLRLLKLTDYTWYKVVKNNPDIIYEFNDHYVVMIQYKFAYIDFTSDYPTLIKNVNYLNKFLDSLEHFSSFKEFQDHTGLSKKVLNNRLNTTDLKEWYIKFNDFQILTEPIILDKTKSKSKSKCKFKEVDNLKGCKVVIRLGNKKSNFLLSYPKEKWESDFKGREFKGLDIVFNEIKNYEVSLKQDIGKFFISCLELDYRGNWNVYRRKFRVESKSYKRKFKRIFSSNIFVTNEDVKCPSISSLRYKDLPRFSNIDDWKKPKYTKEYLEKVLEDLQGKSSSRLSLNDIKIILKKDEDKRPRLKWLYQLYNFSNLPLFKSKINIYPFLGFTSLDNLCKEFKVDICKLNYVLIKVLGLRLDKLPKEVFLFKGVEKSVLWKLLHRNKNKKEVRKLIEELSYYGYPHTGLKENVLDIGESKLDYSSWKLERLNYLKKYYDIDNDTLLLYYLINTENLILPNPSPRIYPHKKSQWLRYPENFYSYNFLLKKNVLTILIQNEDKNLIEGVVQMIKDSDKSLEYKDRFISYLFSGLPLNRWEYLIHYISDISLRNELIRNKN